MAREPLVYEPFRTVLRVFSMKITFVTAIALVCPLAAGCASRTAPFDQLDKAQITILRLQGVEAPPAPAPAAQPVPGLPGLPGLPPIPGVSPEQLQQVGAALQQGLQQMLPGVPLPALPGTQPQQAASQQPPMPRFQGFVILAQQPLADADVKGEILDLFGSKKSFQAGAGNCFTPGLGISIQSPDKPGQPPVDLLVSINCNQAKGTGFNWPYPVNGFTPETSDRLTKIYQKFWGQLPPSGT